MHLHPPGGQLLGSPALAAAGAGGSSAGLQLTTRRAPATPAPATTALAAATPSGGLTPGGPTPTAALSSELTVTQTLTFGPGPFTLGDPRVGLADLASYTATLTITFEGTVKGQAAKWARLYV